VPKVNPALNMLKKFDTFPMTFSRFHRVHKFPINRCEVLTFHTPHYSTLFWLVNKATSLSRHLAEHGVNT
jgi:hypothetical protein